MALVGRHNIAKMTSLTTGTGTLTLLAASPGFNTFANAGVANGEIVNYTIRDGANTEVGYGTYTSAGTTLSRTTVLSSTNSGNKITCSGHQTVMISLPSEDITPFGAWYGSGDNVSDATDGTTITLDTESIDQIGIGSLSSNTIVLARKGWYLITANVAVTGVTAFNGWVVVRFLNYYPILKSYLTAQGVVEDYVTFSTIVSASTDSYVLDVTKIDNHVGSSIFTYVDFFSVLKVGNK